MNLAVVVYLIVSTTVILFLTLSSQTSHREGHPDHHHHLHITAGRRLQGHKHAPFDPLVGKLERWMEEKGGSSMDGNHPPASNSNGNSSDSTFFGDELSHDDAEEEYFRDDEEGVSFNITRRLLILFPLIDRAPQDGFISLKELETWNVERAVERLNFKTIKEMRLRDKDGDGSLSLSECLHHFSLQNLEGNDMAPGQVGWWKQQFRNADADVNGFLNFSELNDFLNPKDSENEEIQEWLLREKIRYMDNDKDGKLNFVEFREQAYDFYKYHAEFEYLGNDIPKPEQKFAELDLNFDKFLTVEELLPILHQLYPGEISYATYYAKYLVHEADDDDKDGKLTVKEMLNHEEVFYSKVFESEFEVEDDDNNFDDDDDDDDDYFHDEFR